MWIKLTLVAMLALVLAGCGGDSAFTPDVGPFTGTFTINTASMGTFTFTANAGALGGTGTLMHNNQPVLVTISANIYGSTIDGTVQNANLGSGSFTGHFDGTDQAYGAYSYTDAGGITTQTGTWTALIN
jgi:hypothetical protein